MFGASASAKQITHIYSLCDNDVERATECLVTGPDLPTLLKLMHRQCSSFPRKRVDVDLEDPWGDMVAFYKGETDLNVQLRIVSDDLRAVDTGGVRRQVYSDVIRCFANNKPFPLFHGSCQHLRPSCTAEARSSGLLRILGMIISHAICQDGIGFPFLSPTCYWYMVGGLNKALEFASAQDLPADSASVVSQVIVFVFFIYQLLLFTCIVERGIFNRRSIRGCTQSSLY